MLPDHSSPGKQIPIGTLVDGLIDDPADYIRQILPHGFESFQITFWKGVPKTLDLARLADAVRDVTEGSGAFVSAVGVYGNTLEADEDAEWNRDSWRRLIDSAHLFGTDLVCGFTGRLRDLPIPDSMERFASVFGPLADAAFGKGVRLAFENCAMGGDWRRGDWNIAHGEDAWGLMFDVLDAENVGLEWEPCHQMINLIDPIPQLKEWAGKVFHVHGKCATIHHDVIRKYGIRGSVPHAHHRTPGFGEADWREIISILGRAGYGGSIDIEGWHDPVYKDDLEMTGQVHALGYLKSCREVGFVRNPD